ncbi:hypothetical protein CB1_000896010 [Camelus ferus]|nr:hypothetical protein CB1_000896010 [Camelus ferus]
MHPLGTKKTVPHIISESSEEWNMGLLHSDLGNQISVVWLLPPRNPERCDPSTFGSDPFLDMGQGKPANRCRHGCQSIRRPPRHRSVQRPRAYLMQGKEGFQADRSLPWEAEPGGERPSSSWCKKSSFSPVFWAGAASLCADPACSVHPLLAVPRSLFGRPRMGERVWEDYFLLRWCGVTHAAASGRCSGWQRADMGSAQRAAHVIAKAKGLAVLSVIKAGFLVTARGGSGIVLARLPDGNACSKLDGGLDSSTSLWVFSSGPYLAHVSSIPTSTDRPGRLVWASLRRCQEGSEKLRNLEGNVSLRSSAAVFTYCKSRGLFAGISLEGSCLIERKETNRKHQTFTLCIMLDLFPVFIQVAEVKISSTLNFPAVVRELLGCPEDPEKAKKTRHVQSSDNDNTGTFIHENEGEKC